MVFDLALNTIEPNSNVSTSTNRLLSPDVNKLQPRVIVGVPAFNEEKTIASVVLGAQKHADIVLVCDDGSKDFTAEIAERLGAVVIRHDNNQGYGAALQSLFKRAKDLNADVLVTLDSDGQHDPCEIPKIIEPLINGNADVVLGSRFIDATGISSMPIYRKLGIKVITLLSNSVAKNPISDSQSGFRAYNKHALQSLSMYATGMSASLEIIQSINKNGLKVAEVPVSCKYRKEVGVKTSTENPLSHGVGLIAAIIKLVVEDRPLKFLGLPGILFLSIGSLFGVWLMNNYALTGSITTNIALASIAFVLMGFFMVSTSITLYAIRTLANKVNK